MRRTPSSGAYGVGVARLNSPPRIDIMPAPSLSTSVYTSRNSSPFTMAAAKVEPQRCQAKEPSMQLPTRHTWHLVSRPNIGTARCRGASHSMPILVQGDTRSEQWAARPDRPLMNTRRCNGRGREGRRQRKGAGEGELIEKSYPSVS